MRWPSAASAVEAVRQDDTAKRRVGVYEGALVSPERVASLAALFPSIEFVPLDPRSPDSDRPFDVLIIAFTAEKVSAATAWLKSLPAQTKVVVVLHEADVVTTRQLMREGAADVLPAPVSEPSMALSLERIFSASAAGADPDRSGEVVAILKAAGGVGASSLGVQAAAILAARGAGQVCFADLDLQYGAAATYLDLPDAISVVDCLSAGASLAETPFADALASHRSGLRLLGAPKDIVSLDAVRAQHVDALLRGLRRDAALTLIDLPQAWTAWTTEVLRRADRIVLITHLTVPHVQMMKRQLRMLSTQHLDATPVVLVCNAVSREQQSSLSLRAAERALDRKFDVVVPLDVRTMSAAINQGVELATVRRGTALEKAVAGLAERISNGVIAATTARR
jgi:pilus assembly protein CpaE